MNKFFYKKNFVLFLTIITFFISFAFIRSVTYAAPTTVNFNTASVGTLNGQYPSTVINWGSNSRWYVSDPWGLFTSNSISYNGESSTSESFTFVSPSTFVSIDAYNGGTGTTTVSLSCTGNPTVTTTVNAGALKNIVTNWENNCSTVTIGSSNGWWTNFDNLIYDPAGGGSTPTPTSVPSPTPTGGPTDTPQPTPTPTSVPTATPTLLPSPTPGTGPNLIYHNVVLDQNGQIVPWYSSNLGESYDHVINLVWNFWINMSTVGVNGYPQYLQRRMHNNQASIGGDQLQMALSSWQLLYQYSGNQAVRSNMEYMANFYLDYGLSSSSSSWPNIPFPANRDGDYPVGPGFFDRDGVSGVGVTQPDKAGSLGAELVTLYKITNTQRYLTSAINIANTLAGKTTNGNGSNSPLPFKVNANNGQVVEPYTTNWTGTLRLFDALIEMNQGNTAQYISARDKINTWLKTYPIQTNNWGPFFEDIHGFSNTEINADTLAWYILENPTWDANWQSMARGILDNTETSFGNATWDDINWTQYGVLPINEQSVYQVPGNSHTSRHASVELIYAEKTGDTSRKAGSIRQLNWATYMVDFDGKNRYPENEIWLTDGYGDYIRHYLRSMAAAPELAPSGENHLLRSTSVIKNITYSSSEIQYTTFNSSSTELLKLNFIPETITSNGIILNERQDLSQEGWVYDATANTLQIRHDSGTVIVISAVTPSPSPTPTPTTTATPTPLPTEEPSPTPTSTSIPSPTPTTTPLPTSTPISTPTFTPTSSPTPSPTPSPTNIPTPTATPSPTPTNTPTPTPTSTPSGSSITFNDLSNPDRNLNGQYPTGVVNWGNNQWYLSSPWGSFTTNSISFTSASVTSRILTFITPKVLTRIDAFNGGSTSTTVTLSCSGNPTRTISVPVNTVMQIATNWTNTCTAITIGSSNGWWTNFDNLNYQ